MNETNLSQMPRPREQKEISSDVKYEVLDNGDVKVTEKREIELIWSPREFLSLHRINKETLNNIQERMSEEYLKSLKKQEEEVTAIIAEFEPYVRESTEKAMEDYENKLVQGAYEALQKKLGDKTLDEYWWQNVWARHRLERVEKIKSIMTDEEKNSLAKIYHSLLKKGIDVKKILEHNDKLRQEKKEINAKSKQEAAQE